MAREIWRCWLFAVSIWDGEIALDLLQFFHHTRKGRR
jgi:hypothetical protein